MLRARRLETAAESKLTHGNLRTHVGYTHHFSALAHYFSDLLCCCCCYYYYISYIIYTGAVGPLDSCRKSGPIIL